VSGGRYRPALISLLLTILLAACALPIEGATRVRLITTGGTIANASSGRLTPQALLRMLPRGAPPSIDVEGEAFANASSTALSLDDWRRLARRIALLLAADTRLAGVVVTSGTDTLEELAFFLHLTIDDRRPIVVVGAMRRPDAPDADGPANLANALRVAAARSARARGTLVAMHGQVHSAIEVQKRHATRVGAFDAPATETLGTVGAAGVAFRRRPAPRPRPGVLALEGEAPLPRVDVLLTYQGATGDLLDAAVNAGARGLVLASAGAGSLTPSQAEAARRLAAHGVPVVLATRTGHGRTRALAAESAGVLSAGDLSALKARVLLMLAIGHGSDRAHLETLFASASGASP
jgi:L-asparaginase